MPWTHTRAMDKSEAAGLALEHSAILIQQICLAMHPDAHRPGNRRRNRLAFGGHLKRISRKRVVGNEPVSVGSAFKISGGRLPGRATREPESSLSHLALCLGRFNSGMTIRTGVATNIPFCGRWRFGGPPTQTCNAIGCGVRQLIPVRALLGGGDKQDSQAQPTYYCHPNP